MPEANQYVLNNKELLELIIKQSDVHEGRWMILVNFGISPGNYGPSADQVSPGVIVAVTQIGIQRAQPETPEGVALDAAVVNPPAKPTKRTTSRRREKS